MSSNYIQNLKNELEAQFFDFKGTLWNYSTNNKFEDDWLLASPINCIGKSYDQFPQNKINEKANNSFRFQVCDKSHKSTEKIDQCIPLQSTRTKSTDSPQYLAVGHSYKLYEEIYKLMISAEKLLDITTLTAPTEEFLVTLTNALTYLSQKPEDERPLVRIAYSQLGSDLGLPDEPPHELLYQLCEKMNSSNKLDIYVLCLEIKKLGIFNPIDTAIGSWNHSKIIAVDGEKVITGGHNLYGAVYLRKFPVFDVSFKMTGEGALHAHDYANQLWRHAAKEKASSPVRYNNTSAARIFKGSEAKYETVSMGGLIGNLSLPPAEMYNLFRINNMNRDLPNYGTIPMLAIGREGLLDVNSIDREPSDTTLVKAISLANRSIKLSVQTLEFDSTFAAFWDEFLLEIAKAMIERNVKVEIIISNPKAISGEAEISRYDNYNGNKCEEVLQKFQKLISEKLKKNDKTLSNLSVIPIHLQDKQATKYIQANTSDNGVGNHAKTILIDDILFYIGSQNFYKSDLNEFGYFIESQQLADQYNINYWNRLLC